MAKPVSKGKSKPTSKVQDEEAFISDDAVSSGSSNYLKFENGENKIRIISKTINGWVNWEDKKPVRYHADEEPEVTDKENPPKKFLAMVVLDRNDGDEVKILELTQQSVIKAIKALAANPDWGAPFGYDLTVTKSGEKLKTKYVVTPSPKKPVAKDVIKAALEKPCSLNALFEGVDPWNVEDEDEATEFIFK
jgi:hypothetical protein